MSEASFTFYRETRFKEVELNGRKVRIPEEWEWVSLKDISEEMYYGVTAKAVTEKTDFKMLRTTDINNYQADWKNLPFCKITDTKRDISKYTLKKGDLIIARAGTVGVSVVVPQYMPDTIFGSYLIKVVLNKTRAEPQFVHYYLQSPFYWTQIRQSAAGGVLKNINLPTLRGIKLPLPPLEEQKKIAEVLRSIDEAIQAVDESIARLERLKKGAMERLLTRGINHTRFKTVELNGRKVEIPEEWEIKSIKDVVKKIKAGGTPKTSVREYYENGTIPFVKIEDLTESGKYLKKTKIFITEAGLKNSNAWIVPKNSLLFAMYGSIGASAITKIPVATNQAILGIIPDSSQAHIEFLYYLLKISVRDMKRQTKHGVQPNLTAKIVKEFKIPLPPLEEQKKISEILRSIDETIEAKRTKKEKLERMKKAVMEKLLTGEIRVR